MKRKRVKKEGEGKEGERKRKGEMKKGHQVRKRIGKNVQKNKKKHKIKRGRKKEKRRVKVPLRLVAGYYCGSHSTSICDRLFLVRAHPSQPVWASLRSWPNSVRHPQPLVIINIVVCTTNLKKY
jgi:hypothetical protein